MDWEKTSYQSAEATIVGWLLHPLTDRILHGTGDSTMNSTRQQPEKTAGTDRRTLLQLGAGAAVAGLFGTTVTTQAGAQSSQDRDDFPAPTYLNVPGLADGSQLRMAVYEQGPRQAAVPVVFSHGFPELAYSWRHQLPALAAAGYRAIAPDQRGYGNTQRPLAIQEYGIEQLCGDLVGVLDALGIDKAVFCGHDWGGAVVWNMPLLHPDRTMGVIGVNTPHGPPSPVPPLQLLRQMMGEDNYIVAFQEPGVAEAVLEANVEKVFRLLMRSGTQNAEDFAKLPADAPERKFQLLEMLKAPLPSELPGKPLLSDDELAYYVETFTRTGFSGGINWYRNIDRNWQATRSIPLKIEQPALYVGAEDDVVLPPSSANGMETFVPRLEKYTIEDCGHWTQQEKPDELNRVILDWLGKTF
jgi:microsomal epoxide hydrolase